MGLDRGQMGASPSGGGPTTYRPPLSVLFVDPDMQRSGQLAHLLRPTCTVEQVATAKAAAEVIARRAPDLIILDLALRDIGGIEFIDYLHTLAATRHTLIMVLTRRASVREKIAALAAGADDYVIWPIDAEAFLVRVRLLSRFRRTLQW